MGIPGTLIERIGSRGLAVLVPILGAAACLTAGAGPVRPIAGSERVSITHNPTEVVRCHFIQEISVTDGIMHRSQNRVQPGYRSRALQRLRNVTAHEGGDTALIRAETSEPVLYPPSFVWTIKADLFDCSVPKPASAAS